MALIRTSRRRQAALAAASGDGMCLADLCPGMSACIVDIDGAVDGGTMRRLHDLGFAPDGRVTVLRKAPLGDPVIVQVGESEVALRKAQCTGIRVAPSL